MDFRSVFRDDERLPAERCPCCGFRTLRQRDANEICPVCFWEDDGQDDEDADEILGGPNGDFSLTMARESFRRIGAARPHLVKHVRKPKKAEI